MSHGTTASKIPGGIVSRSAAPATAPSVHVIRTAKVTRGCSRSSSR